MNTYIKNCEPFVSLPRFAIDNKNDLLCFKIKFSSEKYYCKSHIYLCIIIANIFIKIPANVPP